MKQRLETPRPPQPPGPQQPPQPALQMDQEQETDGTWKTVTYSKRTRGPPEQEQMKQATVESLTRFSEIWSCDYCDNVLSTKLLLDAHIRNKHEMQINDNLQCDICAKVFDTQRDLNEHINTHHSTDKLFLCNDCDFQATSGLILKKHMEQMHHQPSELVQHGEIGPLLKCRDCENEFTCKPDLMDHRRDIHPELRRTCRYKREGNCRYPDAVCWYSHDKKQDMPATNPEGRHKCITCENKFSSKSQMMRHRKIEHPEIVPKCKDGDRCTFPLDECRFIHDNLSCQPVPRVWNRNQDNSQYEKAYPQNTHNNQNFHKTPEKTKPPDQIEILMKEMKNLITEMTQIKDQIQKQIQM